MKQEFLDATINLVLVESTGDQLKGLSNPFREVCRGSYPEAIKLAVLYAFKSDKMEELRPHLDTLREAMLMLDKTGELVFTD